MGTRSHQFGGPWTPRKLNALRAYLNAYCTVMRNQPFSLGYIDAFAGTPSRIDSGDDNDVGFFTELDEEARAYLEGSSRVALEQTFDGYVFIEKREEYAIQLEGLRDEFPERASAIQIRCGDANDELMSIANRSWSDRRAVVLLDPYGMQLHWPTLEALAATQAMDVWVLIPIGVAINRLMPRDGNITPGNMRKLNGYFGTDEWYETLYEASLQADLERGMSVVLSKPSLAELERYIMKRLGDTFADVARPLHLRNRQGSLLYLFCFAAGNPRGAPIAMRIANHIIDQAND